MKNFPQKIVFHQKVRLEIKEESLGTVFETMTKREDMDNLLSKQTISDLKHTERHSESDGSHVVMHFSVSSTQIS